MDYSHNTAEMQQNPNPNSELSFLQSTNYSYNVNSNPYQPTTVDPHNAFLNHPRPPGVNLPYVPSPVTAPYTQHPASYEPQQGADATAATYYQDPNAATYYQDPNAASYYQDPNASWTAAFTQPGATSYAPGVTTTNPAVQSQRNTWKKGPNAKKTKIVQSAWCEVCKINCNSKGVLDQHKLGKKHKNNLEKLKAKFTVVPPPAILAAQPAPVVVPAGPAPLPVFTPPPINKPAIGPDKNPTPIDKPIIGPEEKPKLSNSQKARKKAANARIEDLATKRRRVLEGGAATEAVRACNICNVVCNSDTVFKFHLAGQKHASMIKKYVSSTGVGSAM